MSKIKWTLVPLALLLVLTGCSSERNQDNAAKSDDAASVYENWEAEIETVSNEDTDSTNETYGLVEINPSIGSLQDALEDGYITPAHGDTASDDNDTSATNPTNSLSLGSLEGNVYTNKYAGFGCELTGWELYTSEQLQELSDDVAATVGGSSMGDAAASALSEHTNFYDMAASKAYGIQLVYVMYQKITSQTQWLYSTMTNDEIVDISLLMKDTIIDALEQTGATVISMEKVTVEFLGEQRAAVKTVSETDSVTTYQIQVIDHKCGEYSVSVVVSSNFVDYTQEMLDLFYPVN